MPHDVCARDRLFKFPLVAELKPSDAEMSCYEIFFIMRIEAQA